MANLGWNKRGIRHIEIILSFVIFVAAVGFALWFFSPADSSRLVESSLTYAFDEIIGNVSVGLDMFSVDVDTMGASPVPDIVAVEIEGVADEKNVRVEKQNGQVLPSKRMAGNAKVVDIDFSGWTGEEFVVIKFSEDFEPHPSPPADASVVGSYYEISSSDSKEIISEKRFLALNQSYFEDYFLLKENLNLPGRVSFEFSLVFDDHSIIAERPIPSGLEVFSDTRREEAVTKEGELKFADLIVRIW